MGCKHGLGPGGSTGAAGFSGPRGAKYSVLLYGFPLTARPCPGALPLLLPTLAILIDYSRLNLVWCHCTLRNDQACTRTPFGAAYAIVHFGKYLRETGILLVSTLPLAVRLPLSTREPGGKPLWGPPDVSVDCLCTCLANGFSFPWSCAGSSASYCCGWHPGSSIRSLLMGCGLTGTCNAWGCGLGPFELFEHI